MTSSQFAAILAGPLQAPLTVGRETASELGLIALEHLEGSPTDAELEALARYAARHEEGAPIRDALLAVLLDASGTLAPDVKQRARRAVEATADGTVGSPLDTDLDAVPRRRALADRLIDDRARRLRPRLQALVQAITRGDPPERAPVPGWFLERNWNDLRETLVQRARREPMHREAIARWLAAQPPDVARRLTAVEDELVDAATQAILHTPERAPLAPYCGAERVAEAVRSAVNFRGDPQRARLARYLVRLTPGTPWYDTIAEMTGAQAGPRGRS